MDIQKLVTMGKLEKDITYEGVTFHLATPTSHELSSVNDNVDMLVAFIVKIGDKSFASQEDKEGLGTILRSMQGVMVGSLSKEATNLLEEQSKLIESMSKK